MSDSQTPDQLPRDPLPPDPPKSEKVDPLLESLLARSRPIIAAERGLNAKSRMKIQALGKKMKIPAAVIDQTLQLLHGAPPVQGAGESRYERTFAQIMLQKISDIPGKILTSRIEEKAISVGTRKYQLSEVQARNIVRRMAEEAGVPRVTLTEAERHMEQEIADAIGEETWVTGEKKNLLIRNGKRLGVTADQTQSMIQRHLQFNFKQVQFERKLTDRLWIAAACIVVGTGVALFVFFGLKRADREAQKSNQNQEKKEKPEKDSPRIPGTTESADWWDDSLKLALQKTRLKVNGFAEVHDRLKSPKAATRREGYLQLFSLDAGSVNARLIRKRISAVLPGLFLSEPDSDALSGLLDGFCDSIRMPDGKVPESVDFFEEALWALEMLNEIVGDPNLSDEKVVVIQNRIEPLAGRKFDLFLSAEPRLRKQRRSLFEKYFKDLADIGHSLPERAPEIYEKFEDRVRDEIPEDKLQEFRNVFLTTFLRFEAARWDRCSSLIQKAIQESSVSQISYFIDLMESSEIESLQIYLKSALLKRAGLGTESDSFAESARRLREYFEIDDSPEESLVTPHGELIDGLIIRYAHQWILRSSRLDNRRQAQLLLESAYLSTLVQIQDFMDPEEMDLLIEKGFPDIEDSRYLSVVASREAPSGRDEFESGGNAEPANGPGADERFAREGLRKALGELNQFKILKTARRINAVGLVRRMAPSVSRLSGTDATILARYLLSRKAPQEHQVVLNAIPEFRHWPRLVIAMSDQLRLQAYPHQTCLDVTSLLLNEDLKYQGEGWPKKLSEHLFENGMQQLAENQSRPSQSAEQDPVANLKSILGYYYRLRAEALGINSRLIADGDTEGMLDAILDHMSSILRAGKKVDALEKVARDLEIVQALGKDPLTRLQLKQKALLTCLAAAEKPAAAESGKSEAMLKLENLLKNRLSAIPSVVGQISENEIRILLYYYRQKLE
ncbi:MAG: hypothetical protein VX768_02770 [Planctomycetota bacterium]|nr:hypothetical protein [Planctomycetota bacterium]